MENKPFPFKACKECASGGSNITVDSELSSTSTNPVQNKVVTDAIKNLEPFVVDATVKKGIDNVGNEYLSIKYDGNSNALGYDIIEAYKAKKQIILKLTDENEPRYVHYSSECEWFEYGIIRWHIHIEEKCYTVLLAAMEQDDNYNAFWQIYPDENATKEYVDNAIGDIETSLENIIAKYGLGGDSV